MPAALLSMNLVSTPRIPNSSEAVLQTNGPLLILAGAGSGKTRVIAHRIALPGRGRASRDPRDVLAVTFTNKAAEEMRTRVETLLGTGLPAACGSRRSTRCAPGCCGARPRTIGLSRDFVIYDSTDQLSVVKQALKALDVDDSCMQPRAVLSRISHAKNRMEGPASVRAAGWNPRDEQIGKLYDAIYARRCKDAQRARLRRPAAQDGRARSRSRAGARTTCAQQFRYVMVDEYQDTNRPQYLLIQQLAAAAPQPLPWWAIPTSRSTSGAARTCGTSSTSSATFPKRVIVRLERNYRSTQVILDAASAVIAQNKQPQGKAALDRAEGRRARSCYYRARRRPRRSRLHHPDVPRTATARGWRQRWRRCCIAPTRSRAPIEDALTRERHRLCASSAASGSTSARRSRTRWRTCVSSLNPHDDVSLRRVINVPARGIGKGVMDALEAVERRPPTTTCRRCSPGSAADGDADSLWSKLALGARSSGCCTARARPRWPPFRDLIIDAAPTSAGTSRWRSLSGKVLDQQRLLAGPARRTQPKRPRGASRT